MPLPRLPVLITILGILTGCGAGTKREGLPDVSRQEIPPPPVVRLLAQADFDLAGSSEVLRPAYTSDGLGGQALSGEAVWRIPARDHFVLAEGTVEFRLCLNRPAGGAPNWTMLRIRPSGPPQDSYANGFHVIHGWGRGLFLLVGGATERLPVLAFAGTSNWRPGEWHHCAFTWQIAGPGRSSLAFYVDDALVERRDGLTIDLDSTAWAAAAAAGPEHLAVLAGAVWGQPAPGAIDDIRIYDHARRYQVNP